MNEPRDIRTLWSMSEKDKYHTMSPIGGIKKLILMSLFIKQTHRLRKQTFDGQTGKMGGIN